jgi:hypothetical protein
MTIFPRSIHLQVASASARMNNRPIIGIYAQPYQSSLCPNGKSCEVNLLEGPPKVNIFT